MTHGVSQVLLGLITSEVYFSLVRQCISKSDCILAGHIHLTTKFILFVCNITRLYLKSYNKTHILFRILVLEN